MSDQTTHSAATPRSVTTPAIRVLAVVMAVLLAIDAYVHIKNASQYASFKSSVMSEATLFRIQGVAAIVVAVALLIWPRVITWLLALLVSASAAVAVVLYTYVDVGPLGPLPNLYENTWRAPGKVASAVAETVGVLVAIVGLVLALRARRVSGQRSGR
jgi:glucan phosphoethanolaminetransferase (alkaline phosphatase superfamily)